MKGFSLIEMTIALLVLTFGLLAGGQLLSLAASSDSLARAKGTAALAAQDMLEKLADLYRRDASAMDLALGHHGPTRTQIVNPVNGSVLNQYNIEWNVRSLPGFRSGRPLDARLVMVTVSPAYAGGQPNLKPGRNKVVSISSILSLALR
jgi:prepilin-type N-terminal cleavage/methylation domain-containing protein